MSFFRKKKRQIILLVILFILLIAVNYAFLDTELERFLDTSENTNVARVIDGDTIVSDENIHIRLLGINTPEKGEKYYEEAKDFLNNSIFNTTIKLEFTNDRTDKYGRTLAYIFLGDENVNIKLVENGFANYYFYSGMDKYSDDLKKAWNECMRNNKNLCEKSDDACRTCITIGTSKDFITDNCSFSCDISGWEIKGEGRDKWIFNDTIKPDETKGFELNLANSSGSLFLRDRQGKLVEWEGGS